MGKTPGPRVVVFWRRGHDQMNQLELGLRVLLRKKGHVDEGMNQSPSRAQGAPGRGGKGWGDPLPPP